MVWSCGFHYLYTGACPSPKLNSDTRKGNGEIVGATLVAAHAGEMISELTLAVTSKLTMKALAETVHCYPTQAEVFQRIA